MVEQLRKAVWKMNEALEQFFEKYGDFGKTDKYYGNMHQVLAGQIYTGGADGNLGKKTAWGFDKQKPSFAGRKDVEKAAREYAESRPCITRKATPEELAELDKLLAKKRCRKC
jgi:hypothetical protein